MEVKIIQKAMELRRIFRGSLKTLFLWINLMAEGDQRIDELPQIHFLPKL